MNSYDLFKYKIAQINGLITEQAFDDLCVEFLKLNTSELIAQALARKSNPSWRAVRNCHSSLKNTSHANGKSVGMPVASAILVEHAR